MSNPGPASTQTLAYVGGGQPQYVGTSTSDLVTFYGGTPVDQPAAVTTVTTDAATSTTNAGGFSTSTQADGIVTALNAVIARLRELNLIAT